MNILIKLCGLILASSLFLSGCLPLAKLQGSQSTASHSFSQMKKGDFLAEIKKQNGIISSKQASIKEKAEAHRQLAIIYLVPGNPKRSEKKAVDELGKYLEMTPGGLDKTEAASWATAIGSAKEYSELERKVKKLAAENRQLREQNTRLEDNIEKLKNLDLSLEKKKKNLR